MKILLKNILFVMQLKADISLIQELLILLSLSISVIKTGCVCARLICPD